MHQKKLSMRYSLNIISIFLICIVSAEEFYYTAGFRLFDAGEAIFTSNEGVLNGEKVMKFTSRIKTNSFLSKFYRVDDVVNVWANIEDFSLIQTDKKIREGNYNLDYSAHVSEDLKLITEKTIQLESKVYDPVSAIFMLRKQPLLKNDSYKFTTVENGIIQKVNVLVSEIEKISVPFGRLDARKVIPISDDGKPLFKQEVK